MKRFRLLFSTAVITSLVVWGCTRSPGIETADAQERVLATNVSVPSAHHQLRRNGGWLVDEQGRVVILHGVNAVWKQAPYVAPDSVDGFTAADADWLAAHGFNAVRVGVLFAGVMPQPHMVDSSYLDKIDRIVQLLAARDIYILLDFHQDLYNERYQGEGFPDWATQPSRFDSVAKVGFPLNYFTPSTSQAFDRFWDNADGIQDDYRDAWTAVAARWAAQDHLMGYDVINEPWPGSSWPFCADPQGCSRFENDKLQAMYEKVLAGIRSADQDNIVWLEPQILFDFGVASHLGERAIADSQLGLSWHDYCLPETLLQAAGLKKLPACGPLEQRVFSNARVTSQRLGAASLLSEFGASDDLLDTGRVADLADHNLTGWMVWSYKNWGDPTTQAQGSGAQSLFTQDSDLGSAKQAKLALLERPYPQAIAGTPQGFGYDVDSNTFELSYSTVLPSGSSAVAGAVTEIYVPALHYPAGYSVQVQGGRVVSAVGAARLEVVADAGAEVVTVTVTAP
ncbi:cellulase family glycosylhydrolase [Nevskia soli]|uniref:cellulase family glycosylhydrolase n=1 Tax=Nevskia soli TaxID=418856 RepID=UPI00068FF25C|nr:cellulase family glycosylhydrolase [Nevskia soli]